MSDERDPVARPCRPSGDVQSDVVSYVRASPALDDVPIVRDRSSLRDAPDFSGPDSAWPETDEGRAERERSEPRGLGTAISQRVAPTLQDSYIMPGFAQVPGCGDADDPGAKNHYMHGQVIPGSGFAAV